jgi:hypothetical protein
MIKNDPAYTARPQPRNVTTNTALSCPVASALPRKRLKRGGWPCRWTRLSPSFRFSRKGSRYCQ